MHDGRDLPPQIVTRFHNLNITVPTALHHTSPEEVRHTLSLRPEVGYICIVLSIPIVHPLVCERATILNVLVRATLRSTAIPPEKYDAVLEERGFKPEKKAQHTRNEKPMVLIKHR